jgi:peptide/nickel transport system permease protein
VSRYFTRRILLSIPTLLLVSLLFFSLQQCVPGNIMLETGEGTEGMSYDMRQTAIRQEAQRRRAHLPLFYFSLHTAAQSDTLYRIFPKNTRQRLASLTAQTGNWPAVSHYEDRLQMALAALNDSLPQAAVLRAALFDFLSADETTTLHSLWQQWQNLTAGIPGFDQDSLFLPIRTATVALGNAVAGMQNQKDVWKNYVPALRWNGTQNQYHRWLSGFITGDLGYSLNTQKPVGETIFLSLCTTLFINGTALLLALAIALPLGMTMAHRAARPFDRRVKTILIALYSMPGFWLGSLLILLLATPGFGWNILPGVGIEQWNPEQKSFFQWIFDNGSKFILPIVTIALHVVAIFALQMRGAAVEVLQEDYIRTARAKGLPEQQVVWKHAFRNAVFPVITLVASAIPSVIAGSLVIDYLFAMPGMVQKHRKLFATGICLCWLLF